MEVYDLTTHSDQQWCLAIFIETRLGFGLDIGLCFAIWVYYCLGDRYSTMCVFERSMALEGVQTVVFSLYRKFSSVEKSHFSDFCHETCQSVKSMLPKRSFSVEA
jgi:hypothetical protein